MFSFKQWILLFFCLHLNDMTVDNAASDGCMNNNDTTYESPEVCAGEGSKHENDVSVSIIATKQTIRRSTPNGSWDNQQKTLHPTFSGAGSIAMKKNKHYTSFKYKYHLCLKETVKIGSHKSKSKRLLCWVSHTNDPHAQDPQLLLQALHSTGLRHQHFPNT